MRSSVSPHAFGNLASILGLLLVAGCFSPEAPLPAAGGTSSSSGSIAVTDLGSTATTEVTTGMDAESSSGAPPAVCGNGVLEIGEVCDDGVNDGSYEGCQAGCGALGPYCGDGVTNISEDCDDGDDLDGNGCNVDCVISGSLLWTVTYDGPEHGMDRGQAIAFDSQGNVVVAGNTSSEQTRALISKYSPEGALLWSQESTTPNGDAFYGALAILPNDDIIVGGSFRGEDGDQDAWIRRYARTGELAWTESYSSPQNGWDRTLDIVVDAAGNIYVLLESNQAQTTSGHRTLLRKYDDRGTELWTISTEDEDRAYAMVLDPQDNIVLAGRQYSPNDAPWLQWRTSDGTELHTHTFDKIETNNFIDASALPNGSIACLLHGAGNSSTVVTADTAGTILNSLRISPRADHTFALALSLHTDANSNILTGGFRGLPNELWLTKYSMDGTEQWTNTADGRHELSLAWDTVKAIATDSSGNVAATGDIYDVADTFSNIWIAKYAP